MRLLLLLCRRSQRPDLHHFVHVPAPGRCRPDYGVDRQKGAHTSNHPLHRPTRQSDRPCADRRASAGHGLGTQIRTVQQTLLHAGLVLAHVHLRRLLQPTANIAPFRFGESDFCLPFDRRQRHFLLFVPGAQCRRNHYIFHYWHQKLATLQQLVVRPSRPARSQRKISVGREHPHRPAVGPHLWPPFCEHYCLLRPPNNALSQFNCRRRVDGCDHGVHSAHTVRLQWAHRVHTDQSTPDSAQKCHSASAATARLSLLQAPGDCRHNLNQHGFPQTAGKSQGRHGCDGDRRHTKFDGK